MGVSEDTSTAHAMTAAAHDVDELDALAQAAYRDGKLEAALQHWEELHRVAAAAGDRARAARAAANVAVFLMMDTGLMAPVRGWMTRAERLLEDHEETPTHAWLAVVHTYERFMCGDMAAARVWAERAIDIGARQGEPAPEAIGRLAAGRLLIFDGEIDEGLRLLDEAAVATLSGQLDSLSVGIVYCELICAMQGLAQYDRAAEWTEAMERWRGGVAYGGINGRCRVHRAEILRLRGSCADAEAEALRACEELRPWMRREFGWPLTELGTIRLLKGDLDGAEQALLAAHENGWDPQPALALLRLEQGDVAGANALIRDALDHPSDIPSKERPPRGDLSRAPLLEAQVVIALASDDVETARAACSELGRVADFYRSEGLRASAALARARVALADGDARSAADASNEACAGWSEIGAPYEAAVARSVLAQAQAALGNHDRARLELDAAAAAFERIGASGRAATARRGARPSTVPSAKDAAVACGDNVFRLEGDTRRVEFGGAVVLLRDLKGMRYLERLLVEPGREFHVLDLAADSGQPRAGFDLATPLLDPVAKEALRSRLHDIDDDIDEATRLGDIRRAELAQADRDYLLQELARTFGLGGRDRTFTSDSERARASVTRALRYAVTRITSHHRALGQHLERTLRTGTYCAYDPDPRSPIEWIV